MRLGDVIKTKSVKVSIQDGVGYIEYKAPKGQGFKLLMLGVDSLRDEDEKFSGDQALNALGWVMVDGQIKWHEDEIARLRALAEGTDTGAYDEAIKVHEVAKTRLLDVVVKAQKR